MTSLIESCPYCASAKVAAGPTTGAMAYRTCLNCGSGYLPHPPIEFRDYYSSYDPPGLVDLPDLVARRYSEMLGRLESMVTGRRILEVGCGNGHFLMVAQRRGWEARGVELSRAHAERARAMGLDVRYGDLVADGHFSDERFDAVVMIEVIEHVPEPRSLLSVCRERLEKGGVIFLTTPNYGSITRRLLRGRWSVLSAEHVGLASPGGLRRALNDTGYQVLELRSKSLYLGEYWKLVTSRDGTRSVSLAAENAELRDRIEDSGLLRGAKAAVNRVLDASGLGEALECWARNGPRTERE